GTFHEIPTRQSKLSQLCHGCGVLLKKPMAVRWHECACGIGPVQRDLYSAFLAASLDLQNLRPSIAQATWESAETRLRAAIEVHIQRANEGYVLPRSFGIPRAGARLPRNLVNAPQESCLSQESRKEWERQQEPPVL